MDVMEMGNPGDKDFLARFILSTEEKTRNERRTQPNRRLKAINKQKRSRELPPPPRLPPPVPPRAQISPSIPLKSHSSMPAPPTCNPPSLRGLFLGGMASPAPAMDEDEDEDEDTQGTRGQLPPRVDDETDSG